MNTFGAGKSRRARQEVPQEINVYFVEDGYAGD